jgi:hypothetical protein
MTRKRPVFVKEYSTSDEEEYFEPESENENFDYSNSSKTKKVKRKGGAKINDKTVTKPEPEDDDTELESSTELESEDNTDSEDEEVESSTTDKLNLMISKRDESENFIFKIDKYWPFGLELDEPVAENKKLLYLYSIKLIEEFKTCEHCNRMTRGYQELNLNINCTLQNNLSIEKGYEKFPAAFAKFIKKIDSEERERAIFAYLFKPKCCSKSISTRLGDYKDGKYFTKSPLVKYFYSKSSVHVYLKVDPRSVPLIPRNIDPIIKQQLKKICYESFSKPWTSTSSTQTVGVGKYSDTFDFPEAEITEGFKLNLRNYQLRSISWMKEIESVKPSESNTITFDFLNPVHGECFIKAKLGETPYYVEFNGSQAVTRSAKTAKMEPIRLYGGVLADDTGSGKTATTLGLIHSSPFDDEKHEERYARFPNLNSYIQTGATLIVCPSNIHRQWITEATKCNPKFKIYGFSTILDHRKISTQDIIDADIVVVSYQFLTNSNYNGRKSFRGGHEDFVYYSVKGFVDIHEFHYHRMILDEFHELKKSANKRVPASVKRFQADHVWGLTGTPNSEILSQLFEYSDTSTSFKYAKMCPELNFKHVKRNVPNLELPPIETETVWIDLSAHELALLRWKGRDSSTRQEIMMCAHYQLNEKESVGVNEFMTVENAQITMSKKKSQEIDNLKKQLISLHGIIEKDKHWSNVNQHQSQLKIVENKLASAQSNYNYFQNVFKVIGEPDTNQCLICYDNIPAESLSILPCSHLYCYQCIKGAIERCTACPLCRSPATLKEIFCIRIKKTDTVSAGNGTIDTSLYSSKLVGLYRYITDLISNDNNARIILFLQFSDLADFIGKSFKDLGVEYVRVAGNVFQRQNAISKFRESKNVRLIMMSSEDSVSGINLTQATHVILLHPFWTGNEATDLAYEKQGISRAYRFGLDHSLKIVRFAVRGSIEEEITLRREKIKFST